MTNPLSPVKNTRQTYVKYLEKVITEVQVQFNDETPKMDSLRDPTEAINRDY